MRRPIRIARTGRTDRHHEEADLLATVRHAALRCGWKFYHTHDSRRSDRGFVDVVLVRPPAVIFAELKSQTGTPTDEQGDWLQALSQCQVMETYLWRPSDWDTIVARLQRR